MYLIGSRALELHGIGFKANDNSDYDLISEERVKGFEHHPLDLLNNSVFAQYVDREVIVKGIRVGLVSLKGLAIIKRSHLYRTYKFNKHMNIYNMFLKKYSYNYTEFDNKVLQQRTKMTQEKYGDNHPSLNKTVKAFFDDVVEKKYNHDFLHTLYAHREVPIYTLMQDKTKDTVYCKKELWDLLDYQAKLQCVAEEAYVIATERYLVPNKYKYNYQTAYRQALDRICTNLTSGWFRDFAIDNYELVLGLFSTYKIITIKNILGE